MASASRKLAKLYEATGGPGDVVAGSRRDRELAEFLKGRFEELGLDSRLVPFSCTSWEERKAFVEVNGERVEAVALPYSPSGDVEAELVYVGCGFRPEDWQGVSAEGKVVLMEWFKEELDDVMWQYREAVIRGASAVVVFDAYPGVLRRIVIVVSEDYDWGPAAPPPVPVVAIKRGDGLRLAKLSGKARVRVYVETSVRHDATAFTVEADTGGEPRILVTAHHDRWLAGFADDFLGVGLVLELAEELRELEGLRFISFSGEESGAPGYSAWYWLWGSRVYVERALRARDLEELVAVINFDMPARKPVQVCASGPDFLEPLIGLLGPSFEYAIDLPYFDSYSFTMAGIASMTFHSIDRYAEYYHTSEDLPHRVEWGAVVESLKAAKAVISELTRRGCSFMKYSALKEWITRELKKIEGLSEEARRLREAIERASIGELEARALRAALCKAVFEGRYIEVHKPFSSAYAPQLLAVKDVEALGKALKLAERGEWSGVEEVLASLPGYRVIPGEEEVLPSLDVTRIARLLARRKMLASLRELDHSRRVLADYIAKSLRQVLEGAGIV